MKMFIGIYLKYPEVFILLIDREYFERFEVLYIYTLGQRFLYGWTQFYASNLKQRNES